MRSRNRGSLKERRLPKKSREGLRPNVSIVNVTKARIAPANTSATTVGAPRLDAKIRQPSISSSRWCRAACSHCDEGERDAEGLVASIWSDDHEDDAKGCCPAASTWVLEIRSLSITAARAMIMIGSVAHKRTASLAVM